MERKEPRETHADDPPVGGGDDADHLMEEILRNASTLADLDSSNFFNDDTKASTPSPSQSGPLPIATTTATTTTQPSLCSSPPTCGSTNGDLSSSSGTSALDKLRLLLQTHTSLSDDIITRRIDGTPITHREETFGEEDVEEEDVTSVGFEVVHDGTEDGAEDGFIDVSGENIVSEVRKVVKQLKEALRRVSSTIDKPNILVVGKTGSGKSSLINAIFGVRVAETGAGEPITKHLQKYSSRVLPVVLYDTRGLEHGNSAEFTEMTKKFIAEARSSGDLLDHIHVVWYVVDMAHSRFQPYEARVCETILEKLPIVFVLNKADSAQRSQLSAVAGAIKRHYLPNCKGIVQTVSDRKNYDPTFCPTCRGEDIRFRHKTKEIICDDETCGARTVMGHTQGLEELVLLTRDQLPHLARQAFVSAQEVSQSARLRQAQEIIVQACDNSNVRGSREGLRTLISMTTQLSLLWGFEPFRAVVTQETAHYYQDRYMKHKLTRRLGMGIMDIISSHRPTVAVTVAVGVQICRMISEMKFKAIEDAMANVEREERVSMRSNSRSSSASSLGGSESDADESLMEDVEEFERYMSLKHLRREDLRWGLHITDEMLDLIRKDIKHHGVKNLAKVVKNQMKDLFEREEKTSGRVRRISGASGSQRVFVSDSGKVCDVMLCDVRMVRRRQSTP